MALKKCPLCGSRLLNGSCNECGYSLPDETEISSMYNYDPDDDEFGEKEDFIVPEADDMPKVRDEVERNFRNPYDYKRAPKIETVQKNDVQIQPQQNNQNPYANFTPMNKQGNVANPFPVNNGYNSSSNVDAAFVKDIIKGCVLGLIIPIIGIFYGAKYIGKYNLTKDNRYRIAGIVLLVLSIVRFIL